MAVARERAARPLVATARVGSTVVIATHDGKDYALIADRDAKAVRVMTATDLKPVTHVVLQGTPAQIVVAADGRAYVALRDRSRVQALELQGEGDAIVLSEAGSIEVAVEPVALATDAPGTTLVVTSGWGARLAAYDVTTHEQKLDVALPREPRGVAVSEDGEVAHVAHAVGSRISRVHLGDGETTELTLAGNDFTPRPRRRPICRLPRHRIDIPLENALRSGIGEHIIHERDAVQGFAVAIVDDRVFVPQVLVHRGEVVVGGYGTSTNYPAHQPTLAVVDGDVTTLRVPHQSIQADASRYNFAGGARRDGCLLPRAAVADPRSKSVLIGCMGTDEVRVIDDSATRALTRGTRARWKVAHGPTGIAVDRERSRALVWSQLAQKLSVIPLPEPRAEKEEAPAAVIPKLPEQQMASTVVAVAPIADAPRTLSAAARRGRQLFHSAGDRRISADGRACASCHPDGREDGLTWPTPFGARQTPMLAGRLGDDTVPFGWHGDATSVHEHVKQTFKRLGGTGLSDADLDALIAYCREMPTPPRAEPRDPELVAKGKSLFFADTVGCATCHTNGGGSDGNRHEVGSGPKLDTPSLAFVSGTAPYFHDGRYQTLAELLEHSQGQMGWGSELTASDRRALEAYLLTL